MKRHDMFPMTTSILIVDDSPVYMDMLKSILHELGFTNLVTASDGKKALEVIESMKDTPNAIQLVFSDWVMPHVSGIEFITKIRTDPALAKLPIIMDSSKSEKDAPLEAIKRGANGFLEKPVIKSALVKCLKTVWDQLKKS